METTWFCRAFAGLVLGVAGVTIGAPATAPEAPTSPDGSMQATLFAAEPDINTPIGATVDQQGRLLVIESNTHFRPKVYKGAATDRIRVFEDPHGTGKAEKITTFYEGGPWLMSITTDHDGSILVVSRNELFRLENHDGVAGKKTTLASLQTTATYPHNGLHGVAVDHDGNIFFGIGENYGAPWTLVAADGTKLSDDKGCGHIYRVDSNGGNLTAIAKGFWNPFGLGMDPLNRVWAVDNDPDGRPPSRLVQISPGGDYGFEMRYGRTGLHPLQAWDGELPGTLGMVIGVGEAPCNLKWNRGRMLVTSWRDRQVESYTLTPHGAGYSAALQPVLVGGDNFRPVGMAFASDDTFYLTDWGSSSYQLNGLGRIWKVKIISPAAPGAALEPTAAMLRAESLRKSNDVAELTTALGDSDPLVGEAAAYGLSRLPEVEKIDYGSLTSPEQRIELLAALLWRGSDVRPYVTKALNDSDVRVRQMGVRLITEQGITEDRPELEKLLESPVMSTRLFAMGIAAIAQLDGDAAKGFNSTKVDAVLLARLNSPQTADTTKAIALRMLNRNQQKLKLEDIHALLQSPAQALQLEAVRYLDDSVDPGRIAMLAEISGDAKYGVNVRAEAVDGLAADAEGHADMLLQLAQGTEPALREEALRSLRPLSTKLNDAQRQQLAAVAKQFPADGDLVDRVLGKQPPARPEDTDTAAWEKILDQGPGDPDAGRRIFFHSAGAGCYNCHTIDGRGQTIGPDLTMIGHSQTRAHVLESILQPSKEIAPLFATWRITLKSGEKIDGILLNRITQNVEVYATGGHQTIQVKLGDIVDRRLLRESIMPTGLAQGMSDQELRDLMAMLMQKR